LVSSEGNLSGMVRDYYKNLFLSSKSMEVDGVVQSIKSIVTEDMNNNLTSLFSRVEIEFALNQMALLKAPGPDGMPPIFYQNFGVILATTLWRRCCFALTQVVSFQV